MHRSLCRRRLPLLAERTAVLVAAVLVAAVLVAALGPAPAAAQGGSGVGRAALTDTAYAAARPIPDPVPLPPAFQRAVEAGTRTTTGAPGPTYWANTARYALDATLDPTTRRLTGRVAIRYHNASPDDLRQLVLHLRQNVYAAGVVRNRTVDVTGGMTVANVTLDGRTLPQGEGPRTTAAAYRLAGTRLVLQPSSPIASGDTARVAMDFAFTVPENTFRQGTDGEVFYLGYWYPQMAVYDDVDGWVAEPYMGNGEFYMGYADYDVRLTVPGGWLVAGTGTLQNAGDVLSDTVRARLAEAAATKETVAVVRPGERAMAGGQPTAPGDSLTWHFRAEQVRDVAFGTSDRYVWDATSADTGDEDDGTARIHALYRPGTAAWERAAAFAQFSIEHLSELVMPYPYPHMTAVEGLIGGGMEYPMMTLIGGARTDRSLFSVTYHEISHMWLPMIVGQNEKAYAWMDEGTTTFNTTEGLSDFFDLNGWAPARQYYYRYAGPEIEVPPMRHADRYPLDSPARGLASYGKPGLMLHTLRGLLGNDTFFDAYRTYARRWAYKHPQPHDLFNTFEDVAGVDLDWFWRAAFYETWTHDHAVASVTVEADTVAVTVADEGRMPLPARVTVTFADEATAAAVVPVRTWLGGARTATVRIPTGGRPVTRVTLDPAASLPDVDRTDNTWTPDDAGPDDGDASGDGASGQ